MKHSSANSKPAAVLVSRNLQRAVVYSLVFTMLVQLMYLVVMYGFNHVSFSWPYAVNSIAITAFPVIVFVIAYMTSAAYPQRISRWFVAVLKTLILDTVFITLQSVKNYSSFFVANIHHGTNGPPPAWMTSFVPDYIFMVFCLAGLLAVVYHQRHKA
jgi:hypothetical protein